MGRNFVIDKYIADFCCYKNRLIIEIDGGQHNESKNIFNDKKRQEDLEKLGYRILRVWNDEINENLEGVAEIILERLRS